MSPPPIPVPQARTVPPRPFHQAPPPSGDFNPRVGARHKNPLFPWIIGACALVVLVLFGVAMSDSSGSGGHSNHGGQDLQAEARVYLESEFNRNKQRLFNEIHPVGTAKSVTVNDVLLFWRRGAETGREQDVEAIEVTFTLFWDGPITTGGFTKVRAVYDCDAQAYVGAEIVATNGLTNDDAAYMGGYLLGSLIAGSLGD